MSYLVIPSSVTSIGTNAFQKCSELSDVVVLRKKPISLSTSLFGNYGTLHVLKGSKWEYTDASIWRTFTVVDDCNATLDKTSLSMSKGETANLTAKITPSILAQTLKWNSSNENVVKIDDKGVVTALSEGNATISAIVAGGDIVVNCQVEVVKEILSSGSCGANVNYVLYEDGLLDITGTGDMDMSIYKSPWYADRKSIAKVQIADGVTSLSNNAFNDCSNLISIDIPSSVTKMGYNIFEGCM